MPDDKKKSKTLKEILESKEVKEATTSTISQLVDGVDASLTKGSSAVKDYLKELKAKSEWLKTHPYQ